MASPFSAAADAAWAKDADWIVPILWLSEFRNALAGAIRRRSLTVEEAIAVANLAEAMLDGKEFTVRRRRFFNLFRDRIAQLMIVNWSRWRMRTEFAC